MKYSVRLLLVAVLLLVLAACNNDKTTTENKEGKEKVETSEIKDANTVSSDITGYWKDERGSYYSITKKDDTYSLKEFGSIDVYLKPSNIEGNTINTTITKALNTDNLTMPKEMVNDYLAPGKKIEIKLSDDNNKLNFNLLGEPVMLTKVDNINKADPLDLVGHWMDDTDYFTITKDNNIVSFSFEEEQQQMEVSVEVSDIVENIIFGTVTNITPEGMEDDDLYIGSLAAFILSDDKTKLSILGDSELTKTDMTFEDFKAQKDAQ